MKDNNIKATATLKVEAMTARIVRRVIGFVSRIMPKRPIVVITSQPAAAIIRRLFLLNIVLAFCLAVCVSALLLTHATSQLMTSLAITLVTAVIAIVTSCFLSIGKKLVSKRQYFNKYIFPSDLAHSPHSVSELSQHGESPARASSLKTKYRATNSFPHKILARRSGCFQSRQKSSR